MCHFLEGNLSCEGLFILGEVSFLGVFSRPGKISFSELLQAPNGRKIPHEEWGAYK